MPANTQQISTEQKAELQAKIYRLRLQGFTVREVAAQLGISKSAVSRHAKEAAAAVITPLVEEFRQNQDEQLDRMYRALGPKIDAGDARAIEVATRLLERRAKLFGADAPVQIESKITEYTETDRKLEELARDLFVPRAAGQPQEAQ